MSGPEPAGPAEPVRLAVEDGIATVTLDRAEALNAISTELARALAATFEPLATRRDLRAVVLTGAGAVERDRLQLAGARRDEGRLGSEPGHRAQRVVQLQHRGLRPGADVELGPGRALGLSGGHEGVHRVVHE